MAAADVLTEMKALIHSGIKLSVDERNLLCVAYKNITNTTRSSWRIVDSLAKSDSAVKPSLLLQQQKTYQRNLASICEDVIKLLDEYLIPKAAYGEEKVFRGKMKADYYRYLVESAADDEKREYAEKAFEAYKTAYRYALDSLPAAHTTRLGLALNFAVFFHDVQKSPEKACHLAKNAFDEAVETLEVLNSNEVLRDSFMILHLLKDDLVLWAEEL